MGPVSIAYIAASTNRYSCAACSSKESIVAFGASRFVALWDANNADDNGVYTTLPGHQGIVTAVRFMQDNLLISADDKGELKFWRRADDEWKSFLSKSAHSSPISSLFVYEDLIVTGASDASVRIWRLELDELKEVQTITLKNRYPLSATIHRLPKSAALILAVGTTDRNIQILIRSEDQFVHSATLAGHEDWVKSLAFRPTESDDEPLILASGSQDGTIRLWNIEQFSKQQKPVAVATNGDELSDDLLDAFEASLGDLADAEEGGRQISLKRHILTIKANASSSMQYSITFDALLIGHEAGVTSLSWRPKVATFAEATLLSTSTDSSLILWSPSTILGATKDGNTSLWINRQRFGDVGGQRLGGFIGGVWARDGSETLAWGWNGGWRRWRCSQIDSNSNELEEWTEIGAITGHSAAVKDLSWSSQGEYLISASLDQTTRIHAPIPSSTSNGSAVWHEISRPQVHGYDLVGVSFLGATRFVSIADEKVARVFEAPREFVEIVDNLRIADIAKDTERPRAATVPPLGLSNKAITEYQTPEQNTSYESTRTNRRPFEGELAAMTLWPEVEKVFGHGYESVTLGVSKSQKLVATACKATSPEHAVVRVYDTNHWQLVGEPLSGHALTVTGIAFSPDDRYILTVSRDRSWRLFEKQNSDGGYIPVAADKSHARIIWDCNWSHDGQSFATASRDKTVKIWAKDSTSNKWVANATLKLSDAATAVAFAGVDKDARQRLAVGLENGEIIIYSNEPAQCSEWKEDLIISTQLAHIDHIHRLAWRPNISEVTKQLASCSEDGTLKVLDVHIERV
ncbi:WD40-repeat-containing domain protein [Abortiporus biennis]|nr:WD40-repeat-containing domain protein [Abortiporus biennis]